MSRSAVTTIEYTPIYLGVFLSLRLLIVNIIFALIVFCFLFVLVFPFLFLAFLLFQFVLVLSFDKLDLTIHFLLFLLGRCFCFVNDGSTKPTVFQVSWTDIEIILRICQSTKSGAGTSDTLLSGVIKTLVVGL